MSPGVSDTEGEIRRRGSQPQPEGGVAPIPYDASDTFLFQTFICQELVVKAHVRLMVTLTLMPSEVKVIWN